MKRFLIMALTTLLIVTGAAAQRATAPVPEAISSAELSRYAARLGLSDAQRLAIETYHASYRRAFGDLEAAEIEPFARETGAVRFGLRMLFHRAEVEATLRRLERINAQVRDLDEQLFAEMLAVLSEDQADDIDRVRDARERRRLRSGPGSFAAVLDPASTVDLAELVRDLELDPTLDASIDPVIQRYEMELTVTLRRLHKKTARLLDRMFDRVEASGLDPARQGDRRERNRSFAEMRTIWSETAEALAREVAKVGALNRRTVDTLRLAVPDEAGFRVHDRYYAKAYRDLATSGETTGSRFAAALDRSDLGASVIEEITALHRAWRADSARVVEAAADVIDQTRQTTGSADRDVMAQRNELQQSLEALLEKRAEIAETALAALQRLLEAESATGGDGARAAGGDGAGAGVGAPNDAGNPTAGPATTGPPTPFTLTLPEPFSARDLEDAGTLLGLDETAREIAGTMHGDYLESFGAMQSSPDRASLRRHLAALWSADPETGKPRPPAPDQIALVFRLHRAAIATIDQADAAFFENLEALAGEDASDSMERVRLTRRRDLYRIPGSGRPIGGESYLRALMVDDSAQESRVDVPRLLRDVDLDGADRDAVDAVILEHERLVTSLVQRYGEVALRVDEKLQTLAAARFARPDAPGRGGNRYGPQYHELMTGDGRSYGELRRELIDANRAVRARLAEVLPAAATRALDDLYARAAFPKVYDDDAALGSVFVAALAFPDIGGARRLAIEDLAAEYTSAWDALCRRMIEAHVAEGSAGRWRERAERQRRLERLRRERADLGHRTRLQFRALLLPEQAQRLGISAP